MLNKNKRILQTFKMKEHLFCKKEKNNNVYSYFTIFCVKVLLSCNTHLRSLINIRFLSTTGMLHISTKNNKTNALYTCQSDNKREH